MANGRGGSSTKRIVVLLIIAGGVWAVALMVLFGFNPLELFESFGKGGTTATKLSKGVVVEDTALLNAERIAASQPIRINENTLELKADYFSPVRISQEDVEQLAKIIIEEKNVGGLKFAGLIKEQTGEFKVFLKAGNSVEAYSINQRIGNLGILYFANSLGALVINPNTGEFYAIK
ncbi:MAG: hypothetical protein PWQ20_1473 [Thermotogaceae bacterium]|jgi:hypothetical protein|nr:hypothetical protein [Thermotogaceae bacterium]MDN5338403.1 hypothetical protein [Thermotogaceae bacterium]